LVLRTSSITFSFFLIVSSLLNLNPIYSFASTKFKTFRKVEYKCNKCKNVIAVLKELIRIVTQVAPIYEVIIGYVVSFILGLFSGIILAYYRYILSKKTARENFFQPYLNKLHNVVSEILKKRDAAFFEPRYRRFIEIRDSISSQRLPIFGSKNFKTVFLPYVNFVDSYNHKVELIRQCKEFESIYYDIEKEGISVLRVRFKNLYKPLFNFHWQFSEPIVKSAKNIKHNFPTTDEMKTEDFNTLYNSADIEELLFVNVAGGLFSYAQKLEKEQRKLL
jgi:hypothetical protein